MSVGLFTALHFHFFTAIDEEAHFSYVQQIAQHGSLPVLGKTETSLEGLALDQGVYPRRTTIDPKHYGLGGLSYEAFQPPLYYASAVPAFYAVGNFRDKVYAIRLYGYLLLLVSVVLAARLARAVLADRWMIGWSILLVFFTLPGVVVRCTTVGNLALAVPLTVLFGTELWIAWKRHSTGRLMLAGLLAGLCVLTQLELVLLLPVFALVLVAEARRRRAARTWAPLVVALLIPVVVTAPWFIFNEANYHMLTAASLAIKEQIGIINPHHLHFSINQLPNDTVGSILDPTLPAEWGAGLSGQPTLRFFVQALAVLMVPGSVVLILALGRRLWTVASAILGLPWLLNVVELWYIRYGQQWSIVARYTYPTLPLLLMLASDATETIRARYLPVVMSIGATVALSAIWWFYIFDYTGRFAFP